MQTETTNVKEPHRLLGMANQSSKFSLKLAEVTKPLRDLLITKNSGHGVIHKKQLLLYSLKQLLSSNKILALYNPMLKTILFQ